MTDNKDGGKKDAGRPDSGKTDGGDQTGRTPETGQSKKPYATLDLKATEVKSAAANTATSSPTAASKPAATTPTANATATAASAGATATAGPAMSAAKAGVTAPSPRAAPGAVPSTGPSASTGGASAGANRDAKSTAAQPGAATVAATARDGARFRRPGAGIGGFFTHLAAGLVGGFLALLGADTIGPQIAPQLGWTHGIANLNETQAQLQSRLATLEQAAKPGKDVAEIAARLAAAETRLGKIDELSRTTASLSEAQGRIASDTKAMGETLAKPSEPGPRLVKLEERLTALVKAAETDPQSGRLPQLAQLTAKVTDLETALSAQVGSIREGMNEQIKERLGTVAASAETANAGTQRLDHDVAGLKTDAGQLKDKFEQLKTTADTLGQRLHALQDETGGVKTAVEGLKSDVDRRFATVAPIAAKVAGLETNVQTIVKGEDNRKASAEKIVLSLELANLKRAIDRGQPFAPELAAVAQSSGGKLDLKALEPSKDRGVATIGDLTREFRGAANAALDAVMVPAGAGVVDRLLASAKAVVRVRKINSAPDDTSPEAIIGRMEQGLKGESLAGVIAEAQHLPGPASEAMHEWLAKAQARASVDKAIIAVETGLKTSLAGGAAGIEKTAADKNNAEKQ